MTQDEKNYGRLVWTGLRQMQALRDAVTWALGGQFTFGSGLPLDETTASTWLESQGLPVVNTDKPQLSLVGRIAGAIDQHRINLLGHDALRALRHGQRTRHDTEDFGRERSGAGWADAANFCITSAFLRVLGAWEQYELDVLKSLYYYRPTGESVGPASEQLIIEPELELVYEKPIKDSKNPDKLNYSFPPEWSNVKKKAENNIERAAIFSREFDITMIHGEPDVKKNRKRSEEWYKQRNAIAHGRAKVTMLLCEYIEVEVFVYRAMTHVAEQCYAQYKLLV